MIFSSSFLLSLSLILLSSSSSSSSLGLKSESEPALPTLYEYYIGNDSQKIHSGLTANGSEFHLNQKPFVIYSGSLHYFRLVPQYWKKTLQKFKAAGLNSVQFYIPWNLHEKQPGQFDFESPGLNLTQFLEDIRQADLFAIVRPGPYICAEWEFGGFPSWLLNDPHMSLRTELPQFMLPVQNYFYKILDILLPYQFQNGGGPIIALQFENEYYSDFTLPHSITYLNSLRLMILEKNFKELLFTSDPVQAASKNPIKNLPNVLETANLNENSEKWLQIFKQNQPNRPVFVSEFWPGWFDSWGEHEHHRYSVQKFEQEISEILFKINGSVNFYMFFGGTNFGFNNGARVTTSYDYDAPLSESGNYTEKYFKTKELYQKLVESGRMPQLRIPDQPPKIDLAKNYGQIKVEEYLPFETILKSLKSIESPQTLFMEFLSNNNSGLGFILYRFNCKKFELLNITGFINDRSIYMINSKVLNETEDYVTSMEMKINSTKWFPNPEDQEYQFDILVENLGRANWGVTLMNEQRKGINSSIFLDQQEQKQFKIFTFDFNENLLKQLNQSKDWIKINSNEDPEEDSGEDLNGPKFYRTKLFIEDLEPSDTFLKLSTKWQHGNVFINNFNLGRYDSQGPQQTLYLPGPLLKNGWNWIYLFETGKFGSDMEFIDFPILDKKKTIKIN